MSALRIYVASSSAEIERAEAIMKRLREAGYHVTSSWPEVIRKVGAANPMTAPRADRARWAAQDLSEVGYSDVFWFLLPEGKRTEGAYTEMGYALMVALSALQARQLGIPAPVYIPIVSGTETSIFTALAEHFPTDEAVFPFLQDLAARRAQQGAEDEDEADGDEEEADDEEEKLPPAVAAQLDAIFAKAK